MDSKAMLEAAMAIILIGAGYAIGYAIHGRDVVLIEETVAHEQTQDDGSVILHRDQDGKLDTPAPQIPAGHTPVRDSEVTVLPPPVTVQCPDGSTIQHQCPPATVRFTLVRAPDKTLRVIGSSPDGEVLGGIDVPHEPVATLVPRTQAIGLTLYADGAKAVRYTKDHGRLTLGAEILAPSGRINDASDVVPGVSVAWRFR